MKKLVVQKFGGSSVATAEKIMNIAKRIAQEEKKGNNLVVVVSAMGKTTDSLVQLANEVNPHPSKREMDMLLSTGEQISIALLAMALHRLKVNAVSLTGMQVGIQTDSAHTKAKILHIKTNKIFDLLRKNHIVIVAGFQGVDKNLNITTLGRGGSDTTAVALAAALKADTCEIYTDVEGVYTADPRMVPESRKLDIITYDEMLEMASLGAKVLHSRSVVIAKKYNTKLVVKTSFYNIPGTIIVKEYKNMEDLLITGVTSKMDEAKITICGVPDTPGIAAKIFKALAEEDINVNMIVQSASRKGINDISFTISQSDIKDANNILQNLMKDVKAKDLNFDKNIGVVSIVGMGMASHPGIAQKMFETLGKHGVNIQMISTSEIKISCVIERSKVKMAMQKLHQSFGLDKVGKKILKGIKK
ncbi:MAG: aspartate kinase [Spirochaetes bacterium]|nr:aspartate kinase [Spirochaetota bacterium]